MKSLLFAFFLCIGSSAFANVEVEFLPQLHNTGVYPIPERVVLSQWQILKYIESNPGGVLFVEGLTTPLAYLRSMIGAKIRVHFANGIPERSDMLTDVQRTLLGELNRGQIALALGLVESVLPAENPQLLRDTHQALNDWQLRNPDKEVTSANDLRTDPLLSYILLEAREQFALESIKSELEKRSQPPVRIYLQYGGDHLFEGYSSESLPIRRVFSHRSPSCKETFSE